MFSFFLLAVPAAKLFIREVSRAISLVNSDGMVSLSKPVLEEIGIGVFSIIGSNVSRGGMKTSQLNSLYGCVRAWLGVCHSLFVW